MRRQITSDCIKGSWSWDYFENASGLAPRIFTDPWTQDFGFESWVSPIEGGSYRFPANVTDLKYGEFWQGLSKHEAGEMGSQLFAHDLRIIAFDPDKDQWSTIIGGKTGAVNEDYICHGRPVYAMADGIVKKFRNDVPENPDPPDFIEPVIERAGNHFYIQHGEDMVLYAHMQPDSLNPALLTEGTTVSAGQELGVVGNAGASSEPHLHIHAVRAPAISVGPLRPFVFKHVHVIDRAALNPPDPTGPWVKLDGRAIPSPLCAIWPSNNPPEGLPMGKGEVEIGPQKFWEWPIFIFRSIIRFFTIIFKSLFRIGR